MSKGPLKEGTAQQCQMEGRIRGSHARANGQQSLPLDSGTLCFCREQSAAMTYSYCLQCLVRAVVMTHGDCVCRLRIKLTKYQKEDRGHRFSVFRPWSVGRVASGSTVAAPPWWELV